MRDNTYISGDLIVSGDITSTSASHESTSYTASTHVSGLSGYFGKVGIGTSTNATPERPLVVQGTSMGGMPQGGIVRLADGTADGVGAIAYMEFGGAGSAWNRHSYIGNAGGADSHLWIVNEESAGDVVFYAGNNERARIYAGGDFSITGELRVDNNLLVADAGNDRVGIGTSAPASILNIYTNNALAGELVLIENDGEGDATLSFVSTVTAAWMMGLDNSDSNKFKILPF